MTALFFDIMRYDPREPEKRAADRFVLSKGHAAPLLYAAWAEAGAFPVERLLTLRRIDSDLEGHPTPRFAGTVAATGSLGQGLSIGFGMAWAAKKIDDSDQRIFVLLGDGEMAEGAVWEAVALSAHYALDNLVAFVDVNAHGQSQNTMLEWDVDTYADRLRSFGWNVVTVDGHDMEAVLDAFTSVLGVRGSPSAIVARTIKGKGVSVFESGANWHGKPLPNGEPLEGALAEVAATTDPLPAVPARSLERPPLPSTPPSKVILEAPWYDGTGKVATREAYGSALVRLGRVDPRVVVLDGDTKNSTFAELFAMEFPDRYLEGFIAEQNMVGAAVGLSATGRIPFVSTFAAFHTRAFDQIRMAAISRANLKIAGSHAGVSIGEDGPSQMGLEDIAMMRVIPGSTVLCPADAYASERLVAEIATRPGIQYLRLARPKTAILYDAADEFPIGGSKLLRASEGDRVTIVATGITVFEALEAHRILESQGIAVRVIDAYSIKPVDEDTIRASARVTRGIVLTVEDHYLEGGLGDAVLNALADEPAMVSKLAVREVPRSGPPAELMAAFGIDAQAIVRRVRDLVGTERLSRVASV